MSATDPAPTADRPARGGPAEAERTRRPNLAESVVRALSERIRAGAYRPGEKLPTEPAVMAELGVSRTVVREAMSRLQASGLVVTRHGVGTFVCEAPSAPVRFDPVVSVEDVLAMLELRISLETEAAAIAAARRREEHLVAMQRAVDDFETEITAGRNGVDADFRFHMQVALATGNRYFEGIFRQLGTATIPRTRLDTTALSAEPASSYLHRTNREHEQILDAIRRRDAESARAGMRMHLANSRERLRKANAIADETETAPGGG
ncbi:FadR/GntR family transcriptional regulator [Rhodoplanes roseus]|uniref:GntR family transcriptional regulator n=1 Tax=Rhodoplanes roseus TaxID=29409 RepID=A0A327KY24_9BRAD|nr:FadR/GntR family transcriptional regulator [Rhodoplanes roseus]RAI42072.1 GntR family transcriptional regulator [Rhodoplanes roseus]